MVPEGWTELRLGELARITSGATPKVGTPRYYDSGTIPFLKIQDLTASDSLRVDSAEEQITDAALSETSAKLYPAGTVLVTMYGTIGTVRITSRPMAANQAIAAFLDLRSVDPVFLACLLGYHQPNLESLALQTTQANISGRVLKSYPAVFPPLPEQQKIAAILSSVDDAIAATRKVIEQTKRVKLGLLQTLMTRGIGHTRFEETEIGEVPEAWEVVRLGELYSERKEGGLPALPVMSVTLDDGLVPRESLERRVESNLKPSEHALVRAGDLVYNTMRMWQGASGVATTDCVVSPAYVVAEPNDRILPVFARLLFKAPRTIDALFSYSHGITRDRLRLYFDNFVEVPIALPPLQEQRRIAELLIGLEGLGQHERAAKVRLTRAKRGLMQDLLTGRVRVQPD